MKQPSEIEPKKGGKPGAEVRKSSHRSLKKGPAAKGTSLAAKRARQAAFLKALTRQDVRFNISTACAEVGISRRGFEKWRTEDPHFAEQYEEITEAQIDKWEEALHKNILAGDSTSVIFALKTKGRKRGYIEKDHPTDAKENAILDEFANGSITALEAAVKVHKLGRALPKLLELQLGKPDPPPPPDERPPLSNDELEKKYLETIALAEGQQDGTCTLPKDHPNYFSLPERQEEVRRIKEEEKHRNQFEPTGQYE